jgi:assimilatory nitrate reductase catalytic subunit
VNVKRQLGLDILEEKYAYADDPVMGHTSEQKIPEKWVSTTCGYCSVGCGMFIGVKEGRAVSVRGNPDHPVNAGKLCPKGLSEHYTLEAYNRARHPLLRNERGKLARIGWGEALAVMAEKFRGVQEKYGREALGVVSTGQLVTEEFYTLGKLVQLGLEQRTSTATQHCAWPAPCLATNAHSAATGHQEHTKTSAKQMLFS